MEAIPPPLLSLPEHLLALVVTEVHGGKNGLRSTCRSLRSAVNTCTSALAWTKRKTLAGGARVQAHLPAALTGSVPRHQAPGLPWPDG